MALANFFDRAVTAASNILQGFETDAFQQTLDAQVVGIAFDSKGTQTLEGRVAIELVVNLLSRLYPQIAIIAIDPKANPFVKFCIKLTKEINPAISISSDIEKVNHCIIVGKSTVNVKNPFYIGSKGWICKLNRHKPVESGNSKNPFGAAAAACFGAANVFRSIFQEQLPNGSPDEEINLSLLDYENNGTNKILGPVRLEDWYFVGLGAVGNGMIWTLSRIGTLTGRVHIIDHEKVELTNLQRYVLMKQMHLGDVKVEVAKKYIANSRLEVIANATKWSKFLSENGTHKLKHVAVSVDSAEDRIAVQASLPYYIVNGWTQIGDLGVSRHHFNDDNACLACLYLPDVKQLNEDEIIAKSLRWPPSDLMEIRKRLSQNTGVDRDFLIKVANAFKTPLENLLAFEGQPLRVFYQKAICGGVILNLLPNDNSTKTLVPMAFQSVLAGIMLAGEIVGYATGLKNGNIPMKTTINLLRPLAPYRNSEGKKHSSGRCICQDPDYLSVFAEKWKSDKR